MRIKKIILLILWFILFFVIVSNAEEPKFRVHILKDLAPGFNYSINYPLIIDYDNDGDQDIIIISKEGTLFFLENLKNDI